MCTVWFNWSIVMNIFVQVEECDDTDSNKTEVEEIEMVDMEGRAEVNLFPKPKHMSTYSFAIPYISLMTLDVAHFNHNIDHIHQNIDPSTIISTFTRL